jgi:adenylate cyclase
MIKLPFSIPEKIRAGLILTLIPVIVALVIDLMGGVYFMSLMTYDLLFHLRGAQVPHSQVVVVAIDDESMRSLGRWPWPRKLFAKMINLCRQGGARSVILDFTFAETGTTKEEDTLLAQAMENAGNVVQGYYFMDISFAQIGKSFSLPKGLVTSFLEKDRVTVSGLPTMDLPQAKAIEFPDFLSTAATSFGLINLIPDKDGTVRRAPLFIGFQNLLCPSLAFAAFQHFTGNDAWRFQDGYLIRGTYRIPLSNWGDVLLNYRGPPGSFKSYSFADLLQLKISPEVLKNKWVIVGVTSAGVFDLRVTPFSGLHSGCEIQATLLDNLLTGDLIRQMPRYYGWGLALFLTPFLVFFTLFARRRLFAFLAFFTLWALVGLQSFVAFKSLNYWINPVMTGFSLALAFGVTLSYRYATETQQKLLSI